jgi:hypothetical protein
MTSEDSYMIGTDLMAYHDVDDGDDEKIANTRPLVIHRSA